ncbi:MAG TPA: CBS domain-containing protein [Halalkalibaculum sp.]|nr:CBS domain-containing protein [Halalkalibaculum sp.]
MLAKQALNTEIEPLYGDDAISEAIRRMEALEVASLPVVDDTTGKLRGQVSLQQLEHAESDRSVSDMEMDKPVKIYDEQHIFEAARLMLQYEMRLLPVVDKEKTFIGYLGKTKVLESLTHMLNLAETGSVITVELKQRDFTLTEIVHLIESEGAKILGITVETPDVQAGVYEVSIKLNLRDISRVAATLRRHEYTVLTDSSNEILGVDVETRADELIKYMDM